MKQGIQDIDVLLGSMDAELQPGNYIFYTTNSAVFDPVVLELNPIGFFREKEGMSFILEQTEADKSGIKYESLYCLISLHVHSSLAAVGLTAAISGKLAAENISANVVAAYYHDHIFVPKEKAEHALDAIKELQFQHTYKGSV